MNNSTDKIYSSQIAPDFKRVTQDATLYSFIVLRWYYTLL